MTLKLCDNRRVVYHLTSLLINDYIPVLSLSLYVCAVPAHFKTKFSAQTVRKGQEVSIVCTAFGELPITIVVTKDRMQFDASLEPRYEVVANQRTDSYEMTIKIRETDRRDSSLFTCIAANEYGKDEFNSQIIVQG